MGPFRDAEKSPASEDWKKTSKEVTGYKMEIRWTFGPQVFVVEKFDSDKKPHKTEISGPETWKFANIL